MQSKAPDVPSYIAEAPADRRSALEHLRKLCRETMPGLTECIERGMPAYKRGDTAEVAFASQKQYISLYVMKKDVVDEFREALAANIGKGCIRFKRPADMDFDLIAKLLRRSAESAEAPC